MFSFYMFPPFLVLVARMLFSFAACVAVDVSSYYVAGTRVTEHICIEPLCTAFAPGGTWAHPALQRGSSPDRAPGHGPYGPHGPNKMAVTLAALRDEVWAGRT